MDWGITEQAGWRKGPWTPDEDKLLAEYVGLQGEGSWSSVARSTGLNRSGKSCRLRWVNYLRPGLKKGHITPQEECIIIELHALWGNKWSTIARYLPGRTDNEIKNYWRTHFKKKDKPEKRKANQVISQQKQVQTQLEENFETNKVSPSFEIRKKTEAKQETVLKQNSMADQRVLVNHQDQESWDGLWNLDNQQGCLAIQNQVNSYFSSENTMNLFDRGYIF